MEDKAYWDRAAKTDPYNKIRHGWTKRDFETKRESLFFMFMMPGPRLLDVGCGIGYLYNWCPAYEYHGVDYSPEMIALAVKRCPHGVFALMQDGKIPFQDAYFDSAICELVIQHNSKDDAIALIEEIQRVAKASYVQFPIVGKYPNGWSEDEIRVWYPNVTPQGTHYLVGHT